MYRKYPEEITRLTERIAGYEQDVALAAAHPKAQEGFCGMEVDGRHYTEKEDAGVLKSVKKTLDFSIFKASPSLYVSLSSIVLTIIVTVYLRLSRDSITYRFQK